MEFRLYIHALTFDIHTEIYLLKLQYIQLFLNFKLHLSLKTVFPQHDSEHPKIFLITYQLIFLNILFQTLHKKLILAFTNSSFVCCIKKSYQKIGVNEIWSDTKKDGIYSTSIKKYAQHDSSYILIWYRL